MKNKIIISEDATFELEEAYSWYEDRKEGLGEQLLDEINIILELIQKNPELFPVKHKNKYHEAVLNRFPFVVILSAESNKINVLSFFNTWKNNLRKPS